MVIQAGALLFISFFNFLWTQMAALSLDGVSS